MFEYTKELAEKLKEAIAWIELKVDDDKDRTFDVVATTEDVDRDRETIKVSGWDSKNREKNPVVLANHYYSLENIIWKGLKFYTSGGQKRLKGVFSKSNPLWVLAKNLYNEWMLKAVSVWFLVLQRNETDYKIIEKAELLEVSFVAVPCNPNAISLDWKLYAEAVEKGLIKEVSEGEDEQEEETTPIEEKESNDLDVVKDELKEISIQLIQIKGLLISLADDKAKKDADFEIKEMAQTASRAIAEVCRKLKMK